MSILELYPKAQQCCALQGCYLALELHRQAAVGEVLIYANYIASVDGRISVRNEASGEYVVPGAIANPRDWRLYQELAAQSDVMLTSARYFRQLAKGSAQDLLPVGMQEEYADLSAWRQRQGMAAQPDVVVISRSLDIPAAALEKVQDRRVMICTSEMVDERQVSRLESLGTEVVIAGKQRVEGIGLRQSLAARGYRSAYMIAGPEVHRTLLADKVLNRLFLTTHFQLLGGNAFHTILSGALDDPAPMQLRSLYLDQSDQTDQSKQLGQLFAQYVLMTNGHEFSIGMEG